MLQQPTDSNPAAEWFNSLIARSASKQLPIIELINGATQLIDAGQRGLAIHLYKTWIAHNGEDQFLHAVYLNYGVALSDSGDKAAAIIAFREAIRLKPDFYSPYINLGRTLEDSGQTGDGVMQWLALINHLAVVNGESVHHKLTALQQTGRVLEANNRDAPAEDALRQSIDINSNQIEVIQHWIALRQRQCRWPAIAPWERADRKALLKGISSLSLANLSDDPMFQLAKAHNYAKHAIGRPKPVARRPVQEVIAQRNPLKLRIGYVSSDLREHAVGFAMTDVVEQHDRQNFEIYAYYCGINRTDPTQQRTMAAVDHWCDINGMDDDTAAAKIALDGVDILIDLNGYTKDARTKVFARRPAPIQVNWFGFPGTMGTPYHHYLIADPCIIPQGEEIYYSEKVLRMPCYQPNDRKRVVSPNRPSRAEAGLPEDAFVFCCLNGMQKITPRTFQRWMSILGQVPGSVLWLLTGTDDTNDRLRQQAAQAGISPERLIFAPKKSNPDHLARYPLADLFLDNLPYGAHTTAADSMWMGVPILTLSGRSFAARVCTSVVRAAGVGELECNSPEAYVARAVEYALNREKLAAVKSKLVAGRDTSLLFDTPQLVRNLEDLYRQMWADLIRGALPVPDLRNLDIYHEIGLELDLENIEALSNDDYRALYQQKLSEWNESYPIHPDSRLWRDERAVSQEQQPISLHGRRAVA